MAVNKTASCIGTIKINAGKSKVPRPKPLKNVRNDPAKATRHGIIKSIISF
jgi:hypothetical protein